jgi:hypothetical protein
VQRIFEQKTSSLPIIFRMMGITTSEAGYALTDEDMLEFVFHLHSRASLSGSLQSATK